jgi:hypothetical protein
MDLRAFAAALPRHHLPVGAIVNGLEMLDEQKDETGVCFDLIRKSANRPRRSSVRACLRAAGSAGAESTQRRREGGDRYMSESLVQLSAPRAHVKDRVAAQLILLPRPRSCRRQHRRGRRR